MKDVIFAFFMTWGMFLAIPCPVPIWKEKARGLMLACLPFIGCIVGGVWILAAVLCELLKVPEAPAALIMMAVPFCTTGFIHLDGFMDVCDAVLSRRNLEERQKILKDSRVGAFSVICLVFLMLLVYSLFRSMDNVPLLPLFIIPVTSRACAGIAVMSLRPLGSSQYAGLDRKGKGKVLFLAVLITAVILTGYLVAGIIGLSALFTALGYGIALIYAYRQLDGMSGDISGFCQTIGEACGVLAICVLSSL